jgi:LysM repeat protein
MRKLYAVGVVCLGFLMAACSSAPQSNATPTVEAIVAKNTAAPTITVTASLTLVQQPVEQVAVSSPTPTPTPAPPTETPLPSPTPGPYEYTIQANDTLGFIVTHFGYKDLSTGPGSIIDQVVRMNDSIQSADVLPGPGTVILIPRQTATPTPENVETATAVQATSVANSPNIPTISNVGQYIVQPGDTIVGIAELYSTTLGVLFALNPDPALPGAYSCNPEIPSGGENCNVRLTVGQAINVPAPTPTPTLSPTPSGNETATPTATFVAPMVIFPPEGASAGAGVFNLQWVGVGVLDADEAYLIQVTDLTANKIVLQAVTRDTSYPLPDSLIPTDGQPHNFSWIVYVAKPNADKVYGRVGGAPPEHTFTWASK